MQKRMTLAEVRGLITAYFNGKKIADPTWTPGEESVSDLINTLMKIVVIDGNFNDKLPELDGDVLPFGQAIEEYYINLVPVQDFNDYEADDSGAAQNALKPYRPNFDECVFSERLGRKKFATTVDYDRYEVSLHDEGELNTLTNLVLKRLYDSLAIWRYEVKKNLLGTFANKAIAANAGEAVSTEALTADKTLKPGTIYSQSSKFYIVKKAKTYASGTTITLATDTNASEIEPSMVSELDIPVDTEKGEAFIKAVKDAVENAEFVSEGSSISGSTIGAEEGLVLFLKKGIMSSIEVDTLSGSFQAQNLSIPATIKVVDSFGADANAKVWAMLVDPRGVKLHNNYRAAREQANADGDYVNYFLHNEDTGFISTHTYVKVFMTK